jgi:hypothetical protein
MNFLISFQVMQIVQTLNLQHTQLTEFCNGASVQLVQFQDDIVKKWIMVKDVNISQSPTSHQYLRVICLNTERKSQFYLIPHLRLTHRVIYENEYGKFTGHFIEPYNIVRNSTIKFTTVKPIPPAKKRCVKKKPNLNLSLRGYRVLV